VVITQHPFVLTRPKSGDGTRRCPDSDRTLESFCSLAGSNLSYLNSQQIQKLCSNRFRSCAEGALWTLNSSFHQLKTLEGLRAAERGLLYLLVGVSGCIVSQSRFYLLRGSSIIGLLTPSRNCVSCVYRSSSLSETGRRWPLLGSKQEHPECRGSHTVSKSVSNPTERHKTCTYYSCTV